MVGKEKYFQILGIKPTTDQNTIKKAYRKMALKYHPDKNPSGDAHQNFIRITEAYEIIIGVRRVKPEGGATFKPKTKEEVFAEKVAAAQERWRAHQAEEERKDKEYYQRIAFGWKWRLFQVLAVYTAIFSTLLVCDYYLDGREVSYKSTDREVTLDLYGKIVVVEDDFFRVNNNQFWYESYGRLPIRANYSYLFGDMKSISIMLSALPRYKHNSYSDQRMHKYAHFEGKELYTTVSFNSVYGVFPVLHFMFLVPLFLIFWKRPNLRFSVWRLVSIWIIFPTIVFFTFNNNRIFKLIELIQESI